MANLTDRDLELIRLIIKEEVQPIEQTTTVLKTKLLGANGRDDGGLCGDVKYLLQDHSRLKRNFYILLAFLIGSGVLGVSIWQLVI
jgi:hypothetical protein